MIGSLLAERYQLIKPLGEGGFAKTYLAEDIQRGNTPCVIKHLTPARRSSEFLTTARRLFEAEASALLRLGTHDCIPQLIDAFEAEGEFYLVQAYVDGEPLSAIFRRQVFLSEAEMIALLEEALPILAFIHTQQVIHRDIKPSNLMRRRADGKLVLIDFGAVKQITTQPYTAGGDQLTVSIGTQGYAPPEQLAGRPRFSSDLYGLGMTIIHGLTGRSPTELPENPQTGELLWHNEAPETSSGLAVFLQRLTHPSIYQRYASAEAALEDLNQLDTLSLPLPLEFPETTLTPIPSPYRWLGGVFTSLLVTAIVLIMRQLGAWVPLELLVYDTWVRQQPDLGLDERLLLVEITEADLNALKRTTVSDATLSQAIQILQTHQPRVIGVDLYRDLPQGEGPDDLQGHADLLETLKADNIIAIRKLGSEPSEAIPAPATVTPERVGFNDFPIDRDGVVRRNLMYASESSDSPTLSSFALQLALVYLHQEGINPLTSEINPLYPDLNGTTFFPLGPHFGGYRHVDSRGHQIMLRFRSRNNAVQQLSLSEVLDEQFESALIRDRIVIIGTTAISGKDFFTTPFSQMHFSQVNDETFEMSGVMMHVQATSQFLSIAMDGQRLPWTFPEVIEWLWIVAGATGGGLAGWYLRRLWLFGLGLVGGCLMLVGVPAVVFMTGGWLPVLAAGVAFIGSMVVVALYRSYLPPSPSMHNASTLMMTSLTNPFEKKTD
ncbi:MAG: CHASE2 domain-containing protein [Cyanobacteria bacterium P01_F01_bin.86]